ncbi:menaquinone biosynthesis decarboxylase [Fusibacter paucivorans]|uniref:Menaquinone biosynthesis decarboxylase n=1 Tax=Fusibacter paucivorans TaxID=76009 RepID=A0ABS5PR26_9FIRM|nr:menaquinone biosynthesis decarboxylase [Fusibacter paucivorans]MBS7526502.1 menaquinone biosynthesis decarboxylase [Fusibacter paucivorans]
MTYRDLTSYIRALEHHGWLKTIESEVDPELEITEITDRISKQSGPALMFKHVKGSPYPLIINAMGTYERLALGLGVVQLDDIANRIARYLDIKSYSTLLGKIKAIPALAPLPFIFPRRVRRGACQEVIEAPDLNTLPIIKCWPQDGGKYITLPLVFTKDPETGQQNVGMYRLQVYDAQTTGMHWHLHKDGREIYEKYRKIGRRMPVSVAIGCDPTVIYSATAPLPKMIDEMIFAGFLKNRPVKMVKSITNDILVPADAEFILEGYVDLNEKRREGPFGDHTGYYSLEDDYPVFHLEKLTRKRHPIYPTTIVGKPPMEDCYLGKATERIFLPLLKLQCPEIVDMDFPLEGVFHNCAIVAIKKAFPLHGNKILSALWGLGQMMYTKMIIIVDEDVALHDYANVVKTLLSNATAPSHYILSEGPLDALDHASNRPLQGFRLGIDATRKLSSEDSGKPLSNATIEKAIESIGRGELAIQAFDKTEGLTTKAYFMQQQANHHALVLVDPWIDTGSLSTVAWKIFNNIDPARDISLHTRTDGSLFIGIDATKKGPADGLERPWPDDIVMSDDIIAKVTERWQSYGL